MNLDDANLYRELDPADLGAQIDALPDQFEAGWQKAIANPIPEEVERAQRVALVGQSPAAELVTALYSEVAYWPLTRLPGERHPTWLGLAETLVIRSGVPEPSDPPMAFFTSVGWLIGMLSHWRLIAHPGANVEDALAALRTQAAELTRTVPAVSNPAKRMAGQLIERLPVVHGAGALAVVANVWKRELNRFGKNFAHSEPTPELFGSGANGLFFPKAVTTRIAAVFIRALPFEKPELAQSTDRAHDLYMQVGAAVDTILGRGSSQLAQALTLAQYGEYVAYYVAVANGVDPTSLPATAEIENHSSTENRSQPGALTPGVPKQE